MDGALCYPDGATAYAFSSIIASSDNGAVIQGEKGRIAIANFLWARRVELVTQNGIETYSLDDEPRDGYHHEYNAVMNDICTRRTENAMTTHAHTLHMMEILDIAMAEIGLRFLCVKKEKVAESDCLMASENL